MSCKCTYDVRPSVCARALLQSATLLLAQSSNFPDAPFILWQVRVRGTVRLPSGDVNLVATQLALDREHANLITFTSESGLDPLVDLVMSGGDLRVAIQVGKAGCWLLVGTPLWALCHGAARRLHRTARRSNQSSHIPFTTCLRATTLTHTLCLLCCYRAAPASGRTT